MKIMLVDDRPENLDSLQLLLQRPDLEILTAQSGNEALGMMLDHDLALVLLDVQMPGMDGFEVAELMRRNVRTRRIPIIFVTALNQERRYQFSGYEAGAVDFLFKPLDPFVIRSKVNVFLEIKRNHLVREKLLAELNQAHNRLQEISNRKSEFLSAASHELRTPLTVIKEYTSLVLEEVVGPLNDEQKKCLGSALRNCNRLAGLVNDLLDLDSIESGHSHLQREAVDLGQVLADVHGDFKEKCLAGQQGLILDAPPALPRVLADAGMLTQVLVNLVGNACKFTPAGGQIRIQAQPGPQGVRISVSDTGPGISAENQAVVFEKFTQLNRKPGPGPRGTGLGLPISHLILQLHHVALELDSVQGEGSTFHFTLPLYETARHLQAFIDDGTVADRRGRRPWTLVSLKAPEGGPSPSPAVEKKIQQLFRQGDDRCTRMAVGTDSWLLILLQTDGRGAASFLARLEAELHQDNIGQGNLAYGVREMDLARGKMNLDALREMEFVELELSLEKESLDHEQR